jgi:hypothetical protein
MYRVGLIRIRSDGRYYNENRSHEARNEGHDAHLEKSADWMRWKVDNGCLYGVHLRRYVQKRELCRNATRLLELGRTSRLH